MQTGIIHYQIRLDTLIMPALEIKELRKTYANGIEALKGINL